MNNVEALKSLYVAMGGTLTNTYADIADGIKVSNYVLISDVICAIAKIAIPAELPAVTTEDNGKVLTVSAGKWVAALPASQLPSVTSENAGQVLTVSNEGVWGAGSISPELPAVTSDDDGDMLKVVDGAWAKFTPEP